MKYVRADVGDAKIAVIHHCATPIPDTKPESKTAFYESLISATKSTAMVTLPFAGDGSLLQLTKRLGRSYTAMDGNSARVAHLYNLAAM